MSSILPFMTLATLFTFHDVLRARARRGAIIAVLTGVVAYFALVMPLLRGAPITASQQRTFFSFPLNRLLVNPNLTEAVLSNWGWSADATPVVKARPGS
jgi:hypothetical protein